MRQHKHFILLAFTLLATAGAGCARRTPPVAPGVVVAVEVDGVAQPPIDASRLAARPPDRRDRTWRLWRLSALMGVELAAGGGVVLERTDGTQGGFAAPSPSSGLEAFFAVDEEGGASTALVASRGAAPLPALDVARTLARLRRIRLSTTGAAAVAHHEAGAGARDGRGGFGATRGSADTVEAAVVEPGALAVSLGGGAPVRWTASEFARVPAKVLVPTERGDVPAWSLRDVAVVLVDAKARIASIANAQGQVSTLTGAAWNDATRVPVVRRNQRGGWKFDWVDATTKRPLADGSLRNVTSLRIERGAAATAGP